MNPQAGLQMWCGRAGLEKIEILHFAPLIT
jgi:hypothetical protein